MTFFQRAKAAGQFLFGNAYAGIRNTTRRAHRYTRNLGPEHREFDTGDREKMSSVMLDLRRNNPTVKAISRLRRADVVGPGIRPQAATGNEDLDRRLEELWETYSMAPEVTGTMTVPEIQKQIAEFPLWYGDGGLMMTRNGQVQVIEGLRIGEPGNTYGITAPTEANRVQGVEYAKAGRPIAYYIGTREDGTLKDVQRVPVRNFAFHQKALRPGQLRGVSELASCINLLQDLDEYKAIEMIAAKVAASMAVAVTREDAHDFELANRSTSDGDERLQTFEPGSFNYLNPGEDVKVISTGGRPNSQAIQYIDHCLREIGSAIGIPLEFLLQSIGGSSFSASQGVVLQYQQTVEEEQRSLEPVLNKWWKWKVVEWLKAGAVEAPADSRPFRVRWRPPAYRWVNKAAQVSADRFYVQLGAMSLDDVTAQFGKEASEVMERKAKNIAAAKEIAAKYDLADWRELFNDVQTTAGVDMMALRDTDLE